MYRETYSELSMTLQCFKYACLKGGVYKIVSCSAFQLDEVSETEEQRVLAAAASLDALRFSILTPSGTEFDEDKKDGDSSSSMGVGEKVWH